MFEETIWSLTPFSSLQAVTVSFLEYSESCRVGGGLPPRDPDVRIEPDHMENTASYLAPEVFARCRSLTALWIEGQLQESHDGSKVVRENDSRVGYQRSKRGGMDLYFSLQRGRLTPFAF